MTTRRAFGSMALICVLALTANATGKDNLQRYFSETAGKVKATENAAQKREILSESFSTMSKALDMVEHSASITKNDAAGIESFKAALQEKQDELAGVNGYTRVPDSQLNVFSDYVVQDAEQADQVITISIVTLLLIAILFVLLVR